MYSRQSKPILFARKSLAISLAILARLFCWRRELNRARRRRVCVTVIGIALVVGSAPGMIAAQSGNGRIVTDEVGRKVKIPPRVTRVVTLAPDLTETIYALGLEDRLAGDTD